MNLERLLTTDISANTKQNMSVSNCTNKPNKSTSWHTMKHYLGQRWPDPAEEREVAQLMANLSGVPYSDPIVTKQKFQKEKQQSAPDFHSKHDNQLATKNKKGRRHSNKRLVVSPSGLACPNCSVEISTLWRTCEMRDGASYLCNACGLRYKKGKFCPLCFKVYYDVDTNQVHWKQCSTCLNWTHKFCLQNKGELINGTYVCVSCQRGTKTKTQKAQWVKASVDK